MNISQIIMMSILIEALISYFKEAFIDKKMIWQQVLSLVIGIIVAIAFQVDLPAAFGLEAVVPFIGQVITGVIFSRGSNYVADIIKKLQSSIQPNKDLGSQAEEIK